MLGKMFVYSVLVISLLLPNALGNANIYSDSVEQLTVSSAKFAIDLYREIIKNPDVTNVVFSPVGICAALAMTKMGSVGNSSSQIEKALYLDQIDSGIVNSAFGELNGLLFDKPQSNVTMKGANGAFIDKKAKIIEDYKKALTMFGADIKELDFSDPAGSAEFINAWISEQTDGLISDMLSDDSITPLTSLILTSTIYFSGDWHSGFLPSITEDRAFYVSHYKVIKTPLMYQKGKFRFAYIEPLSLQVLEMPYVNQEISMVVLLPDNFDLDSVEKNLNHENLTNWLSMLKYDTVDVTFPKFKLEENLDLQAPLEKLGITDIFSQGKADLSGITGDKSLNVDEIVHRGVLEVKREGGKVEAERAEARRTPHSESKTVYADHPFVFLIRNRNSGVVYLMGALKRPAGDEMHHDEL